MVGREDRWGREAQRSPRVTASRVLTLVAAFAGGAAAGVIGALWTGPDEGAAWIASVLALPATLLTGMFAWSGLAVVAAVRRAWVNSGAADDADARVGFVPWGSWVFVPLGATVPGFCGVVAGLVPGGADPVAAAAVFALSGITYGSWLHRLARRGLLPFMLPGEQ